MPTEGAVEALYLLSEMRFGPRIHLISQCDEETERTRWAWLRARGFFARTGVLPDHVHFCREPWQKAKVCVDLAVSHFVENRIAAMKHVNSVPNLYLYHPDPAECAVHPQFMRYVFDSDVHAPSETDNRPILLMREWDDAFVRKIASMPVFRHVSGWSRPPPMPLE